MLPISRQTEADIIYRNSQYELEKAVLAVFVKRITKEQKLVLECKRSKIVLKGYRGKKLYIRPLQKGNNRG